jgi:formate hydrogenlyase transcriptional activator
VEYQPEEAFKRSEGMFRALAEHSVAGIFIFQDEEIVYVNPSLARSFGYEPDEMTGKLTPQDIIHAADISALSSRVQQSAEGQSKTERVTCRGIRKDDSQIEIEVYPTAFEYLGEPATMGTLIEATARVADDRDLQRLRTAVDQSMHGVMISDMQSRVLYANRAILRMFGLKEDASEVLGKYTGDYWQQDEERVKGRAELLRKGAYDGEVVFKRGDGSFFHGHVMASLLRDEDGNPASLMSSVIDISDRKRAEEELERALAEVRQLKERLEAENLVLRQEVKDLGHPNIVGESVVMKRTMAQVAEVADTDTTVLILGETGTGKELVARAIHDMSSRKNRPFVAVNCAAIPSALVESELFGREKGAYTGALTRQAGRFEVADGSTLFLDEIGELPIEIQVKLLRVLEQGEFERVGSSKTMRVDVRIVAASNRDLQEQVAAGAFRSDLYYRLNVYPIDLPPLRERMGDIPLLTWAFVGEFAARMGKRIDTIPQSAMEALGQYPWPGNVRELRNVIERSMIRTSGPALRVEIPSVPGQGSSESKTLAEVDREHIVGVLEAVNWRVSGMGGAAEQLGLKPTTLEWRMQKLGIRRPPR